MRTQMMRKGFWLVLTCVTLMSAGSTMARPMAHSHDRVTPTTQLYTGAFMEWLTNWLNSHLGV